MRVLKNFDEINIRKVLSLELPDFFVLKIKLIKDGWDNNVALVNNEYIFRFPKTNTYNLELEIELLRLLKGKITLQIPDIEFVGTQTKFIGYRQIKGAEITTEMYEKLSSLEKENIAFQLAQFTYEFHANLEGAKFENSSLPKRTMVGDLDKFKEEIKNKKYSREFFLRCVKIIDEYESLKLDSADEVTLYGDLHTGNYAYNEVDKKVVGVYDFGDTQIGDICYDFYNFYKFNLEYLYLAASAYEKLALVKLDIHKIKILGRLNTLYIYNLYYARQNEADFIWAKSRMDRFETEDSQQ